MRYRLLVLALAMAAPLLATAGEAPPSEAAQQEWKAAKFRCEAALRVGDQFSARAALKDLEKMLEQMKGLPGHSGRQAEIQSLEKQVQALEW